MSTPAKTFSRRLFLSYQEVIEGRGKDVDLAIDAFAARNRDVDLEQQLTFRQWFAENPRTRAAHAR
ncbi:hypothetical protein MF408_04505 [Nocardioides sp. TF02-7]|nr:hypothetical protein [Nocardioides sp. TF02-7]UMG93486.1 hypothetical protein MF408_04505 [Nocardioides sp. TF02-7]